MTADASRRRHITEGFSRAPERWRGPRLLLSTIGLLVAMPLLSGCFMLPIPTAPVPAPEETVEVEPTPTEEAEPTTLTLAAMGINVATEQGYTYTLDVQFSSSTPWVSIENNLPGEATLVTDPAGEVAVANTITGRSADQRAAFFRVFGIVPSTSPLCQATSSISLSDVGVDACGITLFHAGDPNSVTVLPLPAGQTAYLSGSLRGNPAWDWTLGNYAGIAEASMPQAESDFLAITEVVVATDAALSLSDQTVCVPLNGRIGLSLAFRCTAR